MNRYTSGDYLMQHPTWDEADSPWKASRISQLMGRFEIIPRSLCEVGCGAGGILAHLRGYLGSQCHLAGYDISPFLEDFWAKHKDQEIQFTVGDFLESKDAAFYDVLLLVDVLEHLENPFDFLRRISSRAEWFVFYVPLDLQAQGAVRNQPLVRARQREGHLHVWNKDLVLLMLQECGLEILSWEYAASSVELPTNLWARKIASWPRKFCFSLLPDLTARTLGGFSLLVLAKKEGSALPG
jgi:SAM-dependent methyltransferase